jgi:hypothetical protein
MPTQHLQSTHTHHYPVFAHKFIKARGVGLAFILGTTLLVSAVENFKVVLIDAVSSEDVGDEFQDRGFPGTSLSYEKDGVRCLRLVLESLDDSLLEKLYFAEKNGQR